jgi:hypothetical protein
MINLSLISTLSFLLVFIIFFVLVGLVLELRALHFQSGALLLEPYLQYILLWLFWRWGSHELFATDGLELHSSQSQIAGL